MLQTRGQGGDPSPCWEGPTGCVDVNEPASGPEYGVGAAVQETGSRAEEICWPPAAA
jgi:hypothetical protein